MILVFRDNMKWKMCFTLALPLSIPNEDVVPLWCLKRFMKALKISIKSFEAPKRSAKIKTEVNFYFNTTFWNAKSFQSHDDQVTDTHFEVLPPNPSLSQEDKFSSNWKLLSEICMYSPPEILKYWVGVQRGQSNLMGRRCLFSLGWPPF